MKAPFGGPAGTATSAPPVTWTVVHDQARPAARNMALDHALASTLSTGHGALRLYSWSAPSVSFGRNEPTRDVYSIDRARELGVDYVRRPTGGRAVLHDDELTYAIAVPARSTGGARETYRQVNAGLAVAMRSLGAPVAVAPRGAVAGLDSGPCFRAPAEGEVVVEGRKLVGSAQARIDGVLLQHGSIILGGDQSLLDELSGGPDTHEPPATLREFTPGVAVEDVAAAVAAGMQTVFGGDWRQGRDHGDHEAEAERLEWEKYGTDEWTWRR